MADTLPDVPAAGVPDDVWLLDVREDEETDMQCHGDEP